jgi:hypothetical protein
VENDERRQRLLMQTSKIISQKPRQRRLRSIAWNGALFAAGVLVTLAGQQVTGSLQSGVNPGEIAVVTPSKQETETRADLPSIDWIDLDDAVRNEMLASSAEPAVAAMLLKQAGDIYLWRGEGASAVRCYRQYLTMSPQAEPPMLRGDDTWLLYAMRSEQASKFSDQPFILKELE